MDINLIIPPDPFLGDDRRNAPLGLLYVAATAREAGHNVQITDLRGLSSESMATKIGGGFEVYGFTSSTPSFYNVSNLAKHIKSKNPSS